MFKRLFWLTMGMTVGFGTSFWFYRTVRETVSRYAPERVAEDLARTVRTFRGEVRAALAEGRRTMRQTEAELRSELAAPRAPGPPAADLGQAHDPRGGDRP